MLNHESEVVRSMPDVGLLLSVGVELEHTSLIHAKTTRSVIPENYAPRNFQDAHENYERIPES